MESLIKLVLENKEIRSSYLNSLNMTLENKRQISKSVIIKLFKIGENKKNQHDKIIFLRNSVKISNYLEISSIEYGAFHREFYKEKAKKLDGFTNKINLEFQEIDIYKGDEHCRVNNRIENYSLTYKSNYNMGKSTLWLSNNTSANVYADNVVMNGSKGHGFAAEKANNMYDKVTFNDAKIIGGDNVKNGADRLLNGVEIQTKYCKTGSRCIRECFKEGEFRYIGSNNKPMKIEVPKDVYDDAVKTLEDKIAKGKIPGVTDIKEAKNIVKKGRFTYEQAKNVAKFGRVEGLVYDSINGIKVLGVSFGLSSIITFACALWNGESKEAAAKQAINEGIKIGGVSFVSSILTSQIGRTGIEQSLRPVSDGIVKSIGPKATPNITNSLRKMADKGAKPIYGVAASNNLSKIVRGNIVTSTVTTAILSTVDINRFVKGEISGKQAFKNITTTGSSVVGGSVGAVGGAQIGAMIGSVIPGPGTLLGGMIGGMIGGVSASTISSKAVKLGLDRVIEEDSKILFEIFEKELSKVCFDYLLNSKEMEILMINIKNIGIDKIIRTMKSSSVKELYARNLIIEEASIIIGYRKKVKFKIS